MSATATARPWTLEIESEMDGEVECGNSITIPEINRLLFDSEWADADEWEVSKANAALIVAAVNSFDLAERLAEAVLAPVPEDIRTEEALRRRDERIGLARDFQAATKVKP